MYRTDKYRSSKITEKYTGLDANTIALGIDKEFDELKKVKETIKEHPEIRDEEFDEYEADLTALFEFIARPNDLDKIKIIRLNRYMPIIESLHQQGEISDEILNKLSEP